MAIRPPENRLWWNEPLHKPEIIWISIAFVWGLVMFAAMIYWHLYGEQNLSNEAYRIKPERLCRSAPRRWPRPTPCARRVTPASRWCARRRASDIYMLARLWEWWPILELEKDQSYRLHLSSLDWQHGFSLQPTNINLQVHPNYEMVITITPNETGEFAVVCNEFCGIGHHQMLGKIYVVEGGAQ